MQTLSIAEENYLKSIYHLLVEKQEAGTNAIAQALQTKPASVTEMLKKLAEKKLITYEKYQGVSLTRKGYTISLAIVRKHRLWEFFLVEKLKFKWDEVHDIAEQLEHIQSELLIEKLDQFLGFPTKDPHGDPIPDRTGHMCKSDCCCIMDIEPNSSVKVAGVKNHSATFLKHLEKIELTIGKTLKVLEHNDFDQSVELMANDRRLHISKEVAQNLLVTEQKKK
jgi:DtxR family Mn-dependent transcriptional regulator